MMSILKKFKETRAFFYILKFIIVPIYNIIWINIINIHGRFLYFEWFKTKREFFDLEKNNGVLKIENFDVFKKISKTILAACDKKIIENAKKKLNEVTFDNYNQSNNGTNKYFLDIYDELDAPVKKKIIDFASSDFMISTAAKYLGVYPILSKIVLIYSIPKNYDEKRGAMMFHKDEFGYKSMDIFMAISDIDNESGPLKAIISEFDELGPFARILNEDKSMIPGNRGKVEDANILKKKNVKTEMVTIEGISGTTILIDSFKCYHAGGHCKSNARIQLRILYSTIDNTVLPIIEKFKDKILFNDYLKHEVDNDKFKKFFYEKRSKIFRNLKFGRFLYKYYRALSFKY